MCNVNKVYITSEVAYETGLNPAYLIRLVKKMCDDGILSNDDVRLAGKRNYIFNEEALNKIKNRNGSGK